MKKWTEEDIPDQNGRVAVVTGANSGLGWESARALANAGATVILGVRSTKKGEAAMRNIRAETQKGRMAAMLLDLADLESVQCFAEKFALEFPRLDVLLNNAGVMAIPRRQTKDGFEMQFGTNHLGHYALTGRLLPHLLATPGARVVNVSSFMHTVGRVKFDELMRDKKYTGYGAYSQSKLANLLFTYELQRRLDNSKANVISVGAHPGFAYTNLQLVGPRMTGQHSREWMMKVFSRLLGQSPRMGALPQLYAATAPAVQGGEYFGPDGAGGQRGHPTRLRSSAASYNREDALRLWEVSEELTGIHYQFGSE